MKNKEGKIIKEAETFLDFVELNDFKHLGLDETFIDLDTCSRFCYLTMSDTVYDDEKKRADILKAKEDANKNLNQTTMPIETEGEGLVKEDTSYQYRKVWINLMIIDPYNRIP